MKTLIPSILVLAALALAANAAEVDHAAMGHGAPAVKEGPWSYKGRDNHTPTTSGRWEMVPVPGYGHMFLSAQGLSKDLRCAALANPGVMVDRATRKACGLPEKPVSSGKPAPASHAGH